MKALVLIKIDKKSYKNIDICVFNSVNPLCLIINKAHDYIEERNRKKYLTFSSTNKNKQLLERYTKLFDGIKNFIEKLNNKPGEYEKDFMKTKSNLDDNLPMGKILKLHMLTVIVRSVFEEDGQYYLQVFLDDCLYEL